MTSSLIRASLLLFVVSFVGLVGLNGSVNPAKIHSAKAAALDIVLLSDDASTLQFHLGLADCPDFIAPGDSCTAHVTVDNNGTETAEISPPTGSVSGVLNTCTGEDASNPGAGGPNISLSLDNVTYTGSVHLLDPGDSESFDVTFVLASTIGNACQGKTATITVTIQTGLPVTTAAVATPTPTTVAPQFVVTPAVTPVAQVSAVVVTPVAQVSAVVVTPTATRVSETLPTRLPVTGQGWQADGSNSTLLSLFWGFGAVGLLLLLIALVYGRRERGEE